jgi:hypothetical protein
MSETEITMKNTKAEMLEALQSALQKAEMAEKGKLNPIKEETLRIEKKAIETAKKAVEQNIFSKELNEKFNDLQTALSAEEKRLQELYGVGRELQKLALIIEAGKDSLGIIEAEKAKKEEAAKESLESLRTQYALKSTELQAEYETDMKKLKMERTRESEEYQYNLARTRERENNEWADKKLAREAELLKQEERAAELLSEAEKKTEYIRALEEEVKSIPNLIQSEKESVVADTTETLQKEYDYRTTLADKDSQNSISRLNDKVKYLEKELEQANKSVSILQTKLDKAYSEIRELATKTVESASGVKIIGNTDSKSV